MAKYGLTPQGPNPKRLDVILEEMLCGITHSGNSGRLTVLGDRCSFYGLSGDLEAARNGPCLERRCDRG